MMDEPKSRSRIFQQNRPEADVILAGCTHPRQASDECVCYGQPIISHGPGVARPDTQLSFPSFVVRPHVLIDALREHADLDPSDA